MSNHSNKEPIVETQWVEPSTIVETEWTEPIVVGEKKKIKISSTTSVELSQPLIVSESEVPSIEKINTQVFRDYETAQSEYSKLEKNYTSLGEVSTKTWKAPKPEDVDISKGLGYVYGEEMNGLEVSPQEQEDMLKQSIIAKRDAQKDIAKRAVSAAKAEMNKITKGIKPSDFIRKAEGFDVADEMKIDAFSKQMALKSGLKEDGYFKKLLYNEIKGKVAHSIIEPAVDKKFKELYEKKYKTSLEADIKTQFEKGFVKDEEIVGAAQFEVSSAVADAKAQYKAELDTLITNTQNASNDIKGALEDNYKSLIVDGKFVGDEEQYKKYQQDVSAASEESERIAQGFLDSQNIISSKFNARIRRQISEIEQGAQKKISEEAKKYTEAYKQNPELKNKIESTYKEAYKDVIRTKEEFKNLRDEFTDTATLFSKATLSSFGGAIKGLSSSFGNEAGVVMGDYLENSFVLGETELKGISDLLSVSKLAKSSGQLVGSMIPSLAATAAATLATGGIGAPIAVTLLAGGAAAWMAETADIAGRMYEDIFSQTGDVSVAEKAAKQTLDSQLALMPFYALEGLPFIGKSLKAIKSGAGKMLLGGTAELATEFGQEYPQNLFEEAIRNDKSFLEGLKNASLEGAGHALLNIAPVFFLGAGGQVNVKAQSQAFDLKSKFAELAPDQKQQFLFDLIQKKGDKFGSAYITSLYSGGMIDKAEFDVLLKTMGTSVEIIEKSAQYNLSPAQQKVFSALTFKYNEAKILAQSETNPILKKAAEEKVKLLEAKSSDFITKGATDYAVLTYPNNEQYVFTHEEMERAIGDSKFTNAFEKGEIKIELFGENKAIQSKIDEVAEVFRQKEAAKGKVVEEKIGDEVVSPMKKDVSPKELSEEQITAREDFVKAQIQEIVDSGEISPSVPIEHYENYFRNKYSKQFVETPKLSDNEQQAEKFGSLSETESSGIEPAITAIESAGANAERISAEEIERNLKEADRLLGIKPTTYTSETIEALSDGGKSPLQKKVLGDVKNVVRAVSNLVKTQGKKLSVSVHESEESYLKAVQGAGGSDKDAATKGFYMADDGSIHLNMNRVTSNTMLHEGFHPVLDFMEKNNPEVVIEMFEQLRGVKGAEKFVQYGEQYEGDVTKMKESITEFIASVADGTVKIDATTFDKIKNYIIGALNTLGFKLSKQQLLELKDAKGLKSFANLISEKFKKGEEIKVEEIADKKVASKETVEYIAEEFPYKKSETPVTKRKNVEEVYEQKDIDFANELIDSGLFNSVGEILSWRPDLYLSTAEVKKGIKDIKAGKNSAPARKIIEAAKSINDKGFIELIIGRGGVMDRMSVTLDEWREEIKNNPMPKELSPDEARMAERIKTEEIINREGITQENFETILKNIDWIYSPKEIKNIKTYLHETSKSKTTGAPEVEATEVERKPLGETKGKIQTQKEEPVELKDFLVAYAPMREGKIDDISKGSEGFSDKKYKQWKRMAKQFASDLGMEITEDNNSIGVYGKTSDLPEVSSVVTIKSTGEKAKLFGALMGSLAPEGQHSVALLEYAKDGNAVEHRFEFKDLKVAENFVQNIAEYGIKDVSLLPERNTVIVIDEGNANINKIDSDYGKHIRRHNANTAHNRSIKSEDYGGIIESARSGQQGYDRGKLGENLSAVLELAKARARRLSRDYGEKSKQAQERASEGVADYIAKNKAVFNLPETIETKVEGADDTGQKEIHDTYKKLPTDDSANPEVRRDYEQAGREINAQYNYLTRVLKVKVEFQEGDPYENSSAMFDDIINNNTLKIFKGGEDHAFLGEASKDESGLTLNEKLRAVHDYFGHFVNRNQFGKIGEESAWVDHSKMLSPEAQRAISTETRGQNSYVHQTEANKGAFEKFKKGHELIKEGKVAEGNKLIREGQSEFQYAPQKVALLPKELTDWTKYKTGGKPQFARPLKTEAEANKVTDEKAKQRASFSKTNPRLELKEENWFDKLATSIQNRFRRLGQLQSAAQKAGIDIIDKLDAEMANELLVGRAKAKIDKMEGDVVKSKPNQAPSLFERMSKDKVGAEDLGLYMYAKHAPERNAKVAADRRGEFNEELAKINEKRAELNQITDVNLKATRAAKLDSKEKELQKILMDDGGSGMTNQQSADILAAFDADGKTAKLDEYAKEFREKVIKPNLDNLLEGDLISQEQYDELGNQFSDYVPLLVGEKMEGKIVGKGKSVDLRGKDIYRAKGSNLYGVNERVNPIVAAMFNYQKGVIRAEKNKANKAFLNLAEEIGEPMFKIRRPEYSVKLNSNGEVEYAYRNYEPKTSDNTVELKVDGKPVLIEVADEALLNAMKGMGVTKAVPFLNTVNSWLRNVNTIYNPEFMVSNFIRDVQTAVGNISAENIKNIEAKMLKNIPMAMKGIWQNELGTKSEWADIIQELKDEGGDISWIVVGDINEYSKTLDLQIRKYNSNKTSDKFSKVLGGVLDYYRAASKVAEMASRVAAYKAAIDSGVSKAKAAQLAKNLTVNFEKKGNLGATMDSMYLFANAGIQGTAKMITALGKSKKARAVAGSAIAGSLIMNILNGLINDDEHDKIDDGIKERNLIIMHHDGSYTKIPLPYGFNIFKVMGDGMYEVVTGKRRVGETLGKVGLSVANAFNPLSSATLNQMLSPTITDPFVQLSENKNWRGSPIVPESKGFQPQKKESSKYFSTVRPITKTITGALNDITGGTQVKAGYVDISPEVIDHFIDYMGGGTSRFVMNIFNGTYQLSKGEVPNVSNIPFARTFVGKPSDYRDTKIVYEMADEAWKKEFTDKEVEKFKKAMKNAGKEGRLDEDDYSRIAKQFVSGQRFIKLSKKYPDKNLEELKKMVRGE